MSSLTLSAQPGFTEVPTANFDAGNVASAADLKAVKDAANFAAVRNEQFWGYYRNGETVALPVSPADGYVYARNELLYSWSIYATESAGGACNGTQVAPARGSTTGEGNLLQFEANVDQGTGAVYTRATYFKTGGQDRNDGILMVITHAQRLR